MVTRSLFVLLLLADQEVVVLVVRIYYGTPSLGFLSYHGLSRIIGFKFDILFSAYPVEAMY